MSASETHHIGRFHIPLDVVRNESEKVARFMRDTEAVVLHAEVRYDTDTVEYLALSPCLPESLKHCEAPEFEPILDPPERFVPKGATRARLNEIVDSPSGLGCAGFTASDLERTHAVLAPRRKCIVHGCPNHSDEGMFRGDLCAPCYTSLRHGDVGPTDSFLGDLRDDAKSNASRGLTLATLCDMVLGENAEDRSDEALIRGVRGLLDKAKHEPEPALPDGVPPPPDGFEYWGVGPLPHPSDYPTNGIAGYARAGAEWRLWLCGDSGDIRYALRKGTEIHRLNFGASRKGGDT